ncbi:tigger transposable element-derived protein 4-like [Belonocnema kinseyi]|uniref:tigger transposable element-derived protein 4-like n=1 Tax=Belonocnema kinseyi TaxID=2817044 RepID=UPI00143CD822|nr:tigger transposable element-derived protein 4-like [Belonocnema kinseyi]
MIQLSKTNILGSRGRNEVFLEYDLNNFESIEKIKYTTLSLSEKVKLIRCVEKGVKRKKDIAADFKIAAHFPLLEISKVEWMKSTRNQNIPLSGPIVLEKAEFFAAHSRYEDFKASSGWLEKFKNRNGVIYRTLNGESASVSEEDCEKFLTDILPILLEVYAIEDIFNADKTVCANVSGKGKLELLVIGKSKNPRRVKGVKSLPVLYESNKKAWMTSSVVHLPPNLTAKLQPMDQGIIKNLNVNYRRRIIKRLLKASDEKMGWSDLNLLDTIFDLNKAWADVTSDTIANCFRKAGFVKPDVENLATQEQDETLSDGTSEEWDDPQRMLGFTEVIFENFIDLDTNVIIASEPTDSEILNSIKAQEPSKSDNENDAEDHDVAPPTKLRDAEVGLAIARRFLSEESNVQNTIFSALDMVENFYQRKSCIKQKKVTDFIK